MMHRRDWINFLAGVLVTHIAVLTGWSQDIVIKGGPVSLTEEPPQVTPKPSVHKCNPGPWGNLEYYYTYLEAPSHLMELINTPSSRTSWYLPDRNPAQIRDFLLHVGISESGVDSILEASIPFQVGPDYRLFPPTEVVMSLSTEVRTALYAELRRSPRNHEYINPIIIESGNVSDWFRGSDIKPETVALIEKLTYPKGNATAFSDTAAVLGNIKGDREERLFLKALTRTRSLILNLKVAPDSDFDALRDYWSAGYKNKDILPVFESYAINPNIETLDIAHLLPPTPRKFLYTFPTFSLGVDGTFPDSFWTALNFFNYLPNDQFDNIEAVMKYARSNFVQAQKPYGYGDLLIISDPVSNRIIHACVYIADDIVYTKNGRSLMQPFMLMKIDDLLSRFSTDSKPEIQIWRKIAR